MYNELLVLAGVLVTVTNDTLKCSSSTYILVKNFEYHFVLFYI